MKNARKWAAPVVAALFMSACASGPPDNPTNACAVYKQKRSWYRATRASEERWGVPKYVQLAIIRAESSFDKDAKPPRGRFLLIFPGKRKSSARGYPQAIEQTWESYQRATGNRGASRKNFRDAADFVGWYGSETRRRVGVPVYDAYRQYLAYHEGWGGYARGSYRGKPGLEAAARRVERTAASYRRQLQSCEKRKRNGKTKLKF